MSRISTQTQTDQFLVLLAYEDKLTKLYQRIKSSQHQKKNYETKIEYLQYKNAALEKSLFEYELKSRQKQSSRNQVLLHDVITLEEELVKERNQYKMIVTGGVKGRERQGRNGDKGEKGANRNPLGVIREEPEIENSSSRPGKWQVNGKKQGPTKRNTEPQNENDKQRQRQKDKLEEMEKQLQKYEKSKKIMDLEIKRLRKMNEEYSTKCRRLEKLVDAKSELYGNLSAHLHTNLSQNCFNKANLNMSGLAIFDDLEGQSLFH